MDGELPYWLRVLAALATPAIALLGVCIAFAQWRSAQRKTVMDLFEKRWKIWDDLRSAIGPIIRHGSVRDEDWRAFLRARDGDRFLFGPEVSTYLDRIWKELINHQLAETNLKSEGLDRTKAAGEKYASFVEISGFYDDFERLVRPYMKMHQRTPWPR